RMIVGFGLGASEVRVLVRRRLAELDAAPLASADERGPWHRWDAAAGQLTTAEFAPRHLRTLARARLARALLHTGVVDDADRRLAALALLEEAALVGGELPQDIQNLLTTLSPAELSRALAEATAQQHDAAAARLVAELGARQDPTVLATVDGRPAPLAAALASPVRSVRFAALSAIMEMNPSRSFPGASHVAESLWYFIAGGGNPTAVVAAPGFRRASDWAGQLRAAGFDATPVGSGRDALAAAFDPTIAPRLGVVVLDSDIGQPLLREVLYQLRASDRTARVPILIAASGESYTEADGLAAADPLLLAAPRPHGEGALAELVQRAAALGDDPLPPRSERTAQAAAALGWLARALREGAPYDELRRDAGLVGRTLMSAELAEPSLDALAALGTAGSQTALLDYASAGSLPIETRRRAVEALRASLQQYGVQLTPAEIRLQYDRYNASETADAQTQAVLGEILDLLEARPR
ncbi:MAG TPA: hypothetical protein PKC18_08495, partial [Lacipirellulaceae bacterium]|nr:hypothetical protein [Lacipirellulaceae bacterium]